MGGNAFPSPPLRRIKREEIEPTLEYLVDSLDFSDLTLEYVLSNLMGSLGKQEDSGDIDIALNDRPSNFVGQCDLPVFSLRKLSLRAREVLGDKFVSTKTLKGGQIQTAFPIEGDPSKGRVQVDFISGNPDWLKFTHFSPGLDHSPYKGVFISTMLGVLAKIRPSFKLTEIRDGETITVARVGYHYDLELGLYRRWSRLKPGAKYLSEMDPDVFETQTPESPRFSRLGYIDNPEETLRLLFDKEVTLDEVSTFELLVQLIKSHYTVEEQEQIKDRFCAALLRSGAKKSHTLEELLELDVWKS